MKKISILLSLFFIAASTFSSTEEERMILRQQAERLLPYDPSENRIDLWAYKISDQYFRKHVLPALGLFPELRILGLFNMGINGASLDLLIQTLKKLPQLKELDLVFNEIDDQSLQKLKEEFPNVNIKMEYKWINQCLSWND